MRMGMGMRRMMVMEMMTVRLMMMMIMMMMIVMLRNWTRRRRRTTTKSDDRFSDVYLKSCLYAMLRSISRDRGKWDSARISASFTGT